MTQAAMQLLEDLKTVLLFRYFPDDLQDKRRFEKMNKRRLAACRETRQRGKGKEKDMPNEQNKDQ